MAEPQPVGPENFADNVAQLHAAGMSQNEVARQLDTTRYQVQKISRELGLTWDTSRTFEAVQVNSKLADNEIAEIAEMFRKLAKLNLMEVLEGLNSPADRKALTTVAAIGFDKALAAAQYLASKYQDGGMSEAMAQFDRLVKAIEGSTDDEDHPEDH